jgi:enoyl-[acyl-carrier protein] reductase I
MSTGLMHGKRGLIMGLANDKSIAWGIAQALAAQGAELAFSYQGEALKKRVEPLAEESGRAAPVRMRCGQRRQHRRAVRGAAGRMGQRSTFVVHAIGFADKNELRGRYVDTSRDNFALAMDISVYSASPLSASVPPR